MAPSSAQRFAIFSRTPPWVSEAVTTRSARAVLRRMSTPLTAQPSCSEERCPGRASRCPRRGPAATPIRAAPAAAVPGPGTSSPGPGTPRTWMAAPRTRKSAGPRRSLYPAEGRGVSRRAWSWNEEETEMSWLRMWNRRQGRDFERSLNID